MRNKNRRGGIIDKRFGENNPSLTPEERMLERFTREKQKSSRSTSMFNLDDDEEDLSLTHYGQSLSNMDDFDDAGLGLSDDEEEKKQMDGKIVSRLHFGGFEDEGGEDGDRHKSKHEVMKEIIAKSKMHKVNNKKKNQCYHILISLMCSLNVKTSSRRMMNYVRIWMKNLMILEVFWKQSLVSLCLLKTLFSRETKMRILEMKS